MNPTIQARLPLLAAVAALATQVAAQEATAPAPMPMSGAGMAPGMPAPAPAATFVPGRMIGMRPTEKRPLSLKESERNPYAKRNPHEEIATEAAGDAEELRIRERLSALRVAGRSQGPNGLRILLGDIILEEGRVLPQLLEEQSESLRVVELSEDTVVLAWIDPETGELTGKTMQVAYDLTPSVGYALHGQAGEADEEGVVARRMGVLRVGEDRKRREAGMASRAPTNEIPPEVFKAGQ